jgi:predicted transcriptional regulator
VDLRSEDRLSCPPEVLSRIIDGEAVLLHLGSGMYFGTNEVATVAWGAILKGATVGEVVHAIMREFDVDEHVAQHDLATFVQALVEKGLCRINASP